MNRIIMVLLILFFSNPNAQNMDLYLSLINEGKTDGVKENLPVKL